MAGTGPMPMISGGTPCADAHAGERLHAERLGLGVAEQDRGRRAVVHRRAVARGDRALRGNMLPKGWRKVERLIAEAPEVKS